MCFRLMCWGIVGTKVEARSSTIPDVNGAGGSITVAMIRKCSEAVVAGLNFAGFSKKMGVSSTAANKMITPSSFSSPSAPPPPSPPLKPVVGAAEHGSEVIPSRKVQLMYLVFVMSASVLWSRCFDGSSLSPPVGHYRSLLFLVCTTVLLTRAGGLRDDAGKAGTMCSNSSDCAAGFRCVCPEASPPQPNSENNSISPQSTLLVVDDASPACRSYRTPLALLLDALVNIVSNAWSLGGMIASPHAFHTAHAAESQARCTCVAIDPLPPLPPPPPLPTLPLLPLLPPPPPLPSPPLEVARIVISLSGRALYQNESVADGEHQIANFPIVNELNPLSIIGI